LCLSVCNNASFEALGEWEKAELSSSTQID
jgi:hypothetical protein